MELVTEVQVPTEKEVEDEVQKTLKIIHSVMSNGGSKTSPSQKSNSEEKTKSTPTHPDKKSRESPPEKSEASSPQSVSKGDSIQQLLNDSGQEKQKSEAELNKTEKTENSTATDDNDKDISEPEPENTTQTDNTDSTHDAKAETTPDATANAMDNSTAKIDMSNVMVVGEIKIKEEPPDPVDEDFAAAIPPNAVLTEAQPSEVQDIRNMLPPMPIPSRGPGIRHRYTMIKTGPPPDNYVCEVCQSELGSQKHLQVHKLCHFNTSHVCYACDTYFVHADTLIMHMATLHRDLNPNGQAAIDDGLVCSVCLQRFSSQNNLAKHHNMHMIKDGKLSACR